MWQRIEGLDINESDRVYQCSDTGRFIKTRIVRMPDDQHNAEVRAKNIFLHISGSACDEKGKALSDGSGGFCIAPERAVTLSIGELQTDAGSRSVPLAQAFVDATEKLRIECCQQAKGIDDVIALKMAIPLKSISEAPIVEVPHGTDPASELAGALIAIEPATVNESDIKRSQPKK